MVQTLSLTYLSSNNQANKAFLMPQQNELTLWRQHKCVLRFWVSMEKHGNTIAHRADTRNVSEDFQEHFLCLPQMLCTWQNESTFGKHDHISNVATAMRHRFAGPSVMKLLKLHFVTIWTSAKLKQSSSPPCHSAQKPSDVLRLNRCARFLVPWTTMLE